MGVLATGCRAHSVAGPGPSSLALGRSQGRSNVGVRAPVGAHDAISRRQALDLAVLLPVVAAATGLAPAAAQAAAAVRSAGDWTTPGLAVRLKTE